MSDMILACAWSNTYSEYMNVLVFVHVSRVWSKPLIIDRASLVFFHCVVKCRMSGTSCNFSGAVVVQKSAASLLHSTYCICTLYTTATLLLVVCNLVYIVLSNALHVFWGTDTID